MKEIGVGMMVRHFVHGIGTIARIEIHPIYKEEVCQVDYGNDYHEMYTMDYSVVLRTATHDLIELIQEGDIVNGAMVVGKFRNECVITESSESITTEGIMTIFTKEQYEANCFHVKEENT
jgi:hypothetical protein